MDVLAAFVASALHTHFSAGEIQVLVRELGVRPEEIALRPNTISEFAQAVAQWFADRGRIDELLRAVVDGRENIARRWAKEVLHRGFTRSQRDDLLRELRVSPGDVILNPPSDESHAWEIVEYFIRRSSLWQLVRGIVLKAGASQQPQRSFIDLPQLAAGPRG
ncbi:hypothetical protein HY634_01960 [Candidatus Uhrbacteria bacterium]|nr:hypothetical protein [Candidatus Uhrbacteria bacterium]